MNALEQYFEEVEKAPALAVRVLCSHTTLYRIAAGKTRARRDLARRIELETKGRITRAILAAIADAADDHATQTGGANPAPLAAGEAAEQAGQSEGGAASQHGDSLDAAPGERHRESFSPEAAQ